MMHITACRVMRRGYPGLSGAIIVVQFSMGITIIAAPTGAKHTLSTSCAEQSEGKENNEAKTKIILRNKGEICEAYSCLLNLHWIAINESGWLVSAIILIINNHTERVKFNSMYIFSTVGWYLHKFF